MQARREELSFIVSSANTYILVDNYKSPSILNEEMSLKSMGEKLPFRPLFISIILLVFASCQ